MAVHVALPHAYRGPMHGPGIRQFRKVDLTPDGKRLDK